MRCAVNFRMQWEGARLSSCKRVRCVGLSDRVGQSARSRQLARPRLRLRSCGRARVRTKVRDGEGMQELQRGRHPRVAGRSLLLRRLGLRPLRLLLLLGALRVFLLDRPRLRPPVKLHLV